ncbi:hypothetical protein GCM10023216_28830 [Isoptericola chiayiensis]|uniref:DUF2076 domain-containing protein n=1 Tax=Isoptericola chiayiensis TaxID=579446 RepID=A0ABP8YPN0_9MICO|nr:hypothetical protein [Isoptericola chiayiensis]NOW02196.1 hypothetical protein [Isoptericola chiayiensis]
MGFLDKLLGRSRDDRSIPGMTGGGVPRGYESPASAYQSRPTAAPASPGGGTARSQDEVAIDRYRYLLRTAPPDAVEQAHAEAFAQLTPEQRRQVLAEVGASVPENERATSDDPQSLARMATRAEMRNPGTLENTFRGGGAPGFGSMVGSSLLGTVAGVVIGSAVANAMFGPAFGDPGTPVAEDAAAEAGGGEDAGADGADAAGADGGMTEAAGDPGADAGGDEGLFGGLFGGDGGGFGDFFGGDGGGGFEI